ncbi:MAG: hypothetical protein IK125_06125 [Lachnospiraceae bacterium]|nr:hypothetical protein [Lachnospiraceae bacterium]
MSIPKNETPKKDDAKAQSAKKNDIAFSLLKAREPWSMRGKLIFWPVSLILSFVITALYLFLIMHICYSALGEGSYLLDKPQLLAAGLGLFAIFFLIEYAVRGGNRHLSIVEFCASVYVVPSIVYGILCAVFHSNMDKLLNNTMDRFYEDAAFGYFLFLLMFCYVFFAFLIRCFVAFLGLMSEYAKMKKYQNSKKKKQ